MDTMMLPVAKRGDRQAGKVKWFSEERGFGFITPDSGGDDVFVSHKMLPGHGFRTLKEGQRVTFVYGVDDLGPAALDVDFVWQDDEDSIDAA